jgi:GntR family transcriptional regulator
MLAEPNVLASFSDIAVDKRAPVPVYMQIATALSTLLRSGAIPAGTLLPPERVLCHQCDVSRMTVRHAMGILQREGLIESHPGRGTFVRPRRLQKQEQEFRSFSEEIRQRGGTPESKLISLEVVEPGKAAREFFDLSRSEKVYELCRLRLKDGEPVAAERRAWSATTLRKTLFTRLLRAAMAWCSKNRSKRFRQSCRMRGIDGC